MEVRVEAVDDKGRQTVLNTFCCYQSMYRYFSGFTNLPGECECEKDGG